ncbi:hypothetical protein FFLO_04625 [Filobasidium floriforme]|uniref:Uncharacterized protein n=1 Tax=Filobasidium floriforme TaxID=5210 RepID=A0A8K0JKK3_9TREE|nr:uncharacterized protein HD553DRAFT_360950 [Filobasidium floriforme]KAG7531014.1 hypothetical protein FFLO_04625 [Filobasidium floriforme]KAH8080759.1 hypothetical protein HD553DRAFT_360950 [Filobasidium floriforme]
MTTPTEPQVISRKEVDQDRLVVVFDDPQFESHTTGSTPGQKEDLQKTWPVLTKKMTNVIENEVNELVEMLGGKYTESELRKKFTDELSPKKKIERNFALRQAAQSATESHPKDGYELGVTTAYIYVTLVGDDNPRIEGKVVLWVLPSRQEKPDDLHFRCWRPYTLSLGNDENASVRSEGDNETPERSFSAGSHALSDHTVPESNKNTSLESAGTSGV